MMTSKDSIIAMLPERDYRCGAAFCDDPACNTHGATESDDRLLYWVRIDAKLDRWDAIQK